MNSLVQAALHLPSYRRQGRGRRSGSCVESAATCRNVDVRLPGKGNSKCHGARPVHLIITMIKWIRTSTLSINKSLSGGEGRTRSLRTGLWRKCRFLSRAGPSTHRGQYLLRILAETLLIYRGQQRSWVRCRARREQFKRSGAFVFAYEYSSHTSILGDIGAGKHEQIWDM